MWFPAYTQQIIINSSEELLKDPFLPLAERVKKRTDTLFHKEESLRGFLKSSTDDTSQVPVMLIVEDNDSKLVELLMYSLIR